MPLSLGRRSLRPPCSPPSGPPHFLRWLFREFRRPFASIYTAVGVLVGIRSKERSEHSSLFLLARSLYGYLPFDHHPSRCLPEYLGEGGHPRKPVSPVATCLRQQALGMRHPFACWDFKASCLELGEHAGLCLPVFAYTEKRSSSGRPQRVPPSERNCH